MAAIVLSFWLLFAFADDRAAVSDFLGDAAAQLSSDNANGFLKRFDRDMPGYAKLETEVRALLKVAEVSCSAQVLELKASGDQVEAAVDWYLEVKPFTAVTASERRRELVRLKLKRDGKKFLILSLEPQTLFAAPKL